MGSAISSLFPLIFIEYNRSFGYHTFNRNRRSILYYYILYLKIDDRCRGLHGMDYNVFIVSHTACVYYRYHKSREITLILEFEGRAAVIYLRYYPSRELSAVVCCLSAPASLLMIALAPRGAYVLYALFVLNFKIL